MSSGRQKQEACHKSHPNLPPIFHLWYIIDYFEGELGMQDQSPYWKMTADFGRRSLEMHIDWAEHCAAELRSAK